MARSKKDAAAMPVAAFVGDHHSGGGYVNRGIDDSQFSMAQVKDWAVANKVELVALLGDYADKQRNRSSAIVPLRTQLEQIRDAGIDVGFIQGNHDFDSPPWLSGGGFFWLDKEVVDLHGFLWMGLDYRPRDEILRTLAEDIPDDVTGLIMHQCWSDFMGDVAAPQCGFEDVPVQVLRLVTGDYHGGCMIDTYRGKGGQKLIVANPGATSMQDISEPGEKAFVAFLSDGTFLEVPLKTRVVLRSDVLHTSNDLDRFVGEVGQAIDSATAQASRQGYPEDMWKPLLQVVYSHAIPDGLRRIERVVNGRAHLFPKELKPEKVTKTFKANVAEAKGKAFTPQMLLKEEIDPAGKDDPLDKEAYVLAETLLNTNTKDDVVREIAKYRQRVMEGA